MIGRVVHGLVIGGLCKTQYYIINNVYNTYVMDQTCIQQDIQGEIFEVLMALGFNGFSLNHKTFPINFGLLFDSTSLQACYHESFSVK